jgi:carbamoyltransferase
MLLVAPVCNERRIPLTKEQSDLFGIAKLNVPKSDIPAVTHVDYSARIQTVSKQSHPVFHHLLGEFYNQTGCPVLVNTSFNVRGEPIVCAPEHAYTCFMRCEMDCLVINNYLFLKEEQPQWQDKENWQTTFELD